jgi:hypothetical protein
MLVGILLVPGALADYYAAQNGQTPASPYTTWATAASNIQDAVNAATTNDMVWVGAGRYTVPPNATNYIGTNVVFVNKPMTLRSSNGVPAYTVIDGSGTNRGLAVFYTFSSTSLFVLDGFTISNCWATNMGGGILFNGDNLCKWTGVVQNCVISYNTVGWGTNGGSFRDTTGARGGGFGSYNWNMNGYGLTISNCVFRGNSAVGSGASGGGIHREGYGAVVIADCLMESNSAVNGGGCSISMPPATFERCIIKDNIGSTRGGGLYLGSTASKVKNCLIYNNAAGSGGGVCSFYAPVQDIESCTIVSNYGSVGAGIILRFYNQGAGIRVCNSVIYSNYNNLNIYSEGDVTTTNIWCTNICVYSTNNLNAAGNTGNITNNPRFADWAGKNFRLTPDSPCINTGFLQAWMTNGVDLDGRARIRYGTVDIGAYEVIFSGTIFRFY